MQKIGYVDAILRYPVKSMAGEEVSSAFVGYAGFLGDRSYAFVREIAPAGFPWHTARDQENLLLYRPRYRSASAVAMPVDVLASLEMAPGVNPVFPNSDAFAVDVETPDGRVLPVDSPDLAEMLSRTGSRVAVRFSERSLYDCRPVSIFSNASASALAGELGRPVDRRRFRANLYVDWIKPIPYWENELIGRTLQIGERLQISLTGRDPRCKMVTIDPDTAETSPRLLRHIASVHEGFAGVYGAVLLEGAVKKGDLIALV